MGQAACTNACARSAEAPSSAHQRVVSAEHRHRREISVGAAAPARGLPISRTRLGAGEAADQRPRLCAPPRPQGAAERPRRRRSGHARARSARRHARGRRSAGTAARERIAARGEAEAERSVPRKRAPVPGRRASRARRSAVVDDRLLRQPLEDPPGSTIRACDCRARSRRAIDLSGRGRRQQRARAGADAQVERAARRRHDPAGRVKQVDVADARFPRGKMGAERRTVHVAPARQLGRIADGLELRARATRATRGRRHCRRRRRCHLGHGARRRARASCWASAR